MIELTEAEREIAQQLANELGHPIEIVVIEEVSL
jgi:hypothetical protein